MQIQFKTKYLDEQGHLVLEGRYGDGSPAWQAYSNDGEPLMRPTVCLVEYGKCPEKGNVFIKNYSENEGILECLEKEGIIELVREHANPLNGYVTFYECKVLEPSLLPKED